jgi:hypothetical protein
MKDITKSTFHSERYKDGFIQSHYEGIGERSVVRVILGDGEIRDAKSIRGAKAMITRTIPKR